jgi:HKD family nuclease
VGVGKGLLKEVGLTDDTFSSNSTVRSVPALYRADIKISSHKVMISEVPFFLAMEHLSNVDLKVSTCDKSEIIETSCIHMQSLALLKISYLLSQKSVKISYLLSQKSVKTSPRFGAELLKILYGAVRTPVSASTNMS